MGDEKILEALEPPTPQHTDDYYQLVQERKKKGRRKKGEPRTFVVTEVPWEMLNETELRRLCSYGLKPGSKREVEIWKVLHPGVPREVLIGLIRGSVDPEGMEFNKVHIARERLTIFIYENWKYIWSQLGCNTCCWECPDAKALECELENKNHLPGARMR